MASTDFSKFFPEDAIIPKIDWLNCIPDFCYEKRSSQVHEINKWRIPVYIFENHAAAIKAWYKHRETHPALITFDEHTDTFPPLWSQRVDFPDSRDEKQINDDWLNLLKRTRDRIDTIDVEDFFRKGTILRCDSQGQVFNLYYDEQILTAMYFGLISKAYICAPTTFNPKDHTNIQEILDLYENVHYLEDLLVPRAMTCYSFHHNKILASSYSLAKCLHRDLKDVTLSVLCKHGFSGIDNYILDIDLDYFMSPFFESMSYKDYGFFFELVRNAKAITIATEMECVAESCSEYCWAVEKYNEAIKGNSAFMPHQKSVWTSKELLQGVLSLIDYELSGSRESQDEKCRQFDEMNTPPAILAMRKQCLLEDGSRN